MAHGTTPSSRASFVRERMAASRRLMVAGARFRATRSNRLCLLEQGYHGGAEFSARDHEEIRAKFRTLDQAFPQAAQDRVRARCFEEYPDPTVLGMRSGQLSALRGELSKQRRQLPVRKLFERIPRLLLALKPCVLVSPLAVSQYLPRGRLASESIQFDAVIFDEASQVFPEDAVPALLRATQSIVVGDEKQLPPTAFFRRAFDDEDDSDDDGDEADGAFVGRESILDVLTGQVGGAVGQSSLDVHYRSRHDSLIRFSNHHFYGREGPQAHRRAHHQLGDRPEDPARGDHCRRLRRTGGQAGVTEGEGQRDGARAALPHPQTPRRGPDPLREAL